MLLSYGLALTAVTLATFGQVLLKYGITRFQEGGGEVPFQLNSLIQLSLSPPVLLGLALYFFSALFWILTLSRFQLSEAYPLLGLTFVFVLALSHFFLGEPVTVVKVCGTVLVISGILLIASDGI